MSTKLPIVNRAEWLYDFVLFFDLDCAQNTIAVLLLTEELTETFWLRNSCLVYERKTKTVQGRGPSNINLGIFVCSSELMFCQAS